MYRFVISRWFFSHFLLFKAIVAFFLLPQLPFSSYISFLATLGLYRLDKESLLALKYDLVA